MLVAPRHRAMSCSSLACRAALVRNQVMSQGRRLQGPPPVQTGAAMADGGYSSPMSMQQRQLLHERASMDDLTGHKRKHPEPWQVGWGL